MENTDESQEKIQTPEKAGEQSEAERLAAEALEKLMEQAVANTQNNIRQETDARKKQGKMILATLKEPRLDLPTVIAVEVKDAVRLAKAEIERNNNEMEAVRDEMMAMIQNVEDEFFGPDQASASEEPLPKETSEPVSLVEAEETAARLGQPLISAVEARRVQDKSVSGTEPETPPAEKPAESLPPIEAHKTREELLAERWTLQRKYEELAKQLVEHKMSKEEMKLQQKLLKGKLPSVKRGKMISDVEFTDADYTKMKLGAQEWTLNAVWKRLGEIDKDLSSAGQREPLPSAAPKEKIKPASIKEKEGISTGEETAVPEYESYEVQKGEEPIKAEAAVPEVAPPNEPVVNQEVNAKREQLTAFEKQLAGLIQQKAKIRKSGEKGRQASSGELKKLNKKIQKMHKEIQTLLR